MVSIKRNLGLFFIRSLVFVSFMGLCCAAYAVKCTSSQAPCCKGKTMSCCPHPGYENGKELSYDLSACMTILPINPDGPIVIDPDRPIIWPIEECTSGQTQYKPSGSCGTSSRSCCSDGTWSGWDASCPTTKTCPTSSKPSTKESCYGGYRYRTVTCNKSTGTWTSGSWGSCDCSDSAYESVPSLSGTCCQRKDGTGLRCNMGQETVPYRWVEAGTPCWDKFECGTGELPECNESRKGSYWSKWINDGSYMLGCGGQYDERNGRGYCQQYECRQ